MGKSMVIHCKIPDWFTGKSHISLENRWFPVDFPLSQSIDHRSVTCAYLWWFSEMILLLPDWLVLGPPIDETFVSTCSPRCRDMFLEKKHVKYVMIENDWNVNQMIHNIIYIIYNSGTLHLRGVIENWNPWLWSAVSGSHWISGAASLWPGKKTDWKKDEKGWFARKWVSQANKQTNSAIPYKYNIYIYGSNLGSRNRIEHYWQLYFEATVDPFRTVRPQEPWSDQIQICFPSFMGPC